MTIVDKRQHTSGVVMFKFVVRHLALVAHAALIAILILPWQSHAAGFRSLQLADPGDKDLQVGLWYPSSELPPCRAEHRVRNECRP